MDVLGVKNSNADILALSANVFHSLPDVLPTALRVDPLLNQPGADNVSKWLTFLSFCTLLFLYILH